LERCEKCGKEFASAQALAQHTRDKHGQPVASAPKAQRGTSSKRAKSLRKNDRHPLALALIGVAIVAGLGTYYLISPFSAGPPFPYLTNENWIHVHPYLVIDIAGVNVSIPASIGVLPSGFEPLHTHDNSGLLHVELAKGDVNSHNYTLGDFFSVWSYTVRTVGGAVAPSLGGRTLPVEFTSNDILGFNTNSTYQVVLLVDGKQSTQWDSLNLEQLDYCSAANSGHPCCPSDCVSPTGPASNPLWDGTNNYPYGFGHTIVIAYVRR
jgi:hypothetical protein